MNSLACSAYWNSLHHPTPDGAKPDLFSFPIAPSYVGCYVSSRHLKLLVHIEQTQKYEFPNENDCSCLLPTASCDYTGLFTVKQHMHAQVRVIQQNAYCGKTHSSS